MPMPAPLPSLLAGMAPQPGLNPFGVGEPSPQGAQPAMSPLSIPGMQPGQGMPNLVGSIQGIVESPDGPMALIPLNLLIPPEEDPSGLGLSMAIPRQSPQKGAPAPPPDRGDPPPA